MPGMGLSMGQSLRLTQRTELAQRLEMRLEQRLELGLRLFLKQHECMGQEGIEDPMRVRYFEIPPTASGETALKLIVKQLESENRDDPFEEAANLARFQSLGFSAPELVALLEEEKTPFMITRFDPSVANLATLIERPEMQSKFFEHAKATVSPKLWEYITHQLSAVEKLELITGVEEGETPVHSLPPQGLNRAVQYFGIELAHQLGKELAQQHEKGILKADFEPRNILIRLNTDGKLDVLHTGFRHIRFRDKPLDRKERREHLNDIQEKFRHAVPNYEAFRKAFLHGYLAREKDASVYSIEDTPSAVTIKESTKERLRRLLGKTGYFAVEPTEKKTEVEPESTRSLRDEFEEFVLTSPLGSLEFKQVVTEWTKLVAEALPVEQAAYELKRAYRIIVRLYELCRDNGSVQWEDIENEDEEIRMDSTTATRITKSIRERFYIPSPLELESLWKKLLVLRCYKQYPQLSLPRQYELLYGKFFRDGEFSMAGRTFRKYVTEWKQQKKITSLPFSTTRRLNALFNECCHTSSPINVSQIAQSVGLPPESVEPYIKDLQDAYIREQTKEAGIQGKLPDIPALAALFDLPIETVERAVLRYAKPTDISGEVRAQVAEATSEVAASPEETRESTPEPAAPEAMLAQDDHIIRKITLDPAYPEHTLAEELGISLIEVRNRTARIYTARGLADRAREVQHLISTHPGIEDADIQEVTGLSVTDIHFILRPLLLEGHIRPGGPE